MQTQGLHPLPEHEAACKMMQGGANPTTTVQSTPGIRLLGEFLLGLPSDHGLRQHTAVRTC